jgi:hypothetical protein
MVSKQHNTLLYSRARNLAFTSRNIKSGWSQTGLYPFNPNRVLNEIQEPQPKAITSQVANVTADLMSHSDMLRTPVTYEGLTDIRIMIEQGTALSSPSKHRFQKLANGAEKTFADRAILLDENKLLFEQNNEKMTRSSTRSTVTGTAKIMTYEDIMETQRKRDVKEAMTAAKKVGRKRRNVGIGGSERSSAEELEHGRREIRALGLEEYCSVLQL